MYIKRFLTVSYYKGVLASREIGYLSLLPHQIFQWIKMKEIQCSNIMWYKHIQNNLVLIKGGRSHFVKASTDSNIFSFAYSFFWTFTRNSLVIYYFVGLSRQARSGHMRQLVSQVRLSYFHWIYAFQRLLLHFTTRHRLHSLVKKVGIKRLFVITSIRGSGKKMKLWSKYFRYDERLVQ